MQRGKERKRADTFFPFCNFPQSPWGSRSRRCWPPLLSSASVSFLEVPKVALGKNFLTNSLSYYKRFFLYHPEHGITRQIALVGRLVLRATRRGKEWEFLGLMWRTLGVDLMGRWCLRRRPLLVYYVQSHVRKSEPKEMEPKI